MKKRIFLVYEYDWDSEDILAAFTSLELAQQRVKQIRLHDLYKYKRLKRSLDVKSMLLLDYLPVNDFDYEQKDGLLNEN